MNELYELIQQVYNVGKMSFYVEKERFYAVNIDVFLLK